MRMRRLLPLLALSCLVGGTNAAHIRGQNTALQSDAAVLSASAPYIPPGATYSQCVNIKEEGVYYDGTSCKYAPSSATLGSDSLWLPADPSVSLNTGATAVSDIAKFVVMINNGQYMKFGTGKTLDTLKAVNPSGALEYNGRAGVYSMGGTKYVVVYYSNMDERGVNCFFCENALAADGSCSGAKLSTTSDLPNLGGSNYNDKISASILGQGCKATAYTDANYAGTSYTIPEGTISDWRTSPLTATPAGGRALNDNMSSLKCTCTNAKMVGFQLFTASNGKVIVVSLGARRLLTSTPPNTDALATAAWNAGTVVTQVDSDGLMGSGATGGYGLKGLSLGMYCGTQSCCSENFPSYFFDSNNDPKTPWTQCKAPTSPASCKTEACCKLNYVDAGMAYYWDSGSQQCKACHSACKSCSGTATTCQACVSDTDFTLDGSTCRCKSSGSPASSSAGCYACLAGSRLLTASGTGTCMASKYLGCFQDNANARLLSENIYTLKLDSSGRISPTGVSYQMTGWKLPTLYSRAAEKWVPSSTPIQFSSETKQASALDWCYTMCTRSSITSTEIGDQQYTVMSYSGAARYWGLQNGDSCFCGDMAPGANIIKDESQCTKTCPGDTTGLKCGEAYWMNVYTDAP